MTTFASIPLETFTEHLFIAPGITGAVVMAFFTTYDFGGAYSSRIQNVFRKIGVSFLAAAGVSALQVEAMGVFRTIVVLRTDAFVEIGSLQFTQGFLRCVELSAAQTVIVVS